MNTIDFYLKIGTKPQAAFVIFYATDGMPWKDYPIDNSGRHGLTIPTCLMLNRADGLLGFIGGKVDGDETLEQAAIREVQEEIGHTVQLNLEPLIAHDLGPITTHAFAAHMTYAQLRKIQDDAIHAPHFGSEVTGLFLPHLIDYEREIGKHGGLVNLLKSAMAPSVREEMMHLLLKKEIVSRDHLEDLCIQAGYILSELLK